MSSAGQPVLAFGPYRLDIAEKRLLRDGVPVALTPKAFETLVALVERRGHLVEKDVLMKAVWSEAYVEESNLTNNIYALRRVLDLGENGQSYIETVPKRGYRFTAPVEEVSPDEAPRKVLPALAATRFRFNPALVAIVVIVVSAVAVYGGYRLVAERSLNVKTSSVPFPSMDISRVTTTGNITHAVVSADGEYVASVVKDAAGNSLWLKHQKAPSNVLIAGPAQTEYLSVTFAPDIKSIFFIALDHDKGESTLFRVPLLGGTPEAVSTDVYPVGFSPDGKKIAFVRMGGPESMLVLASADGSNQRVVAKLQKPDLFEGEWNAPSWSPDARTIAFPVSLNDDRGHYGTVIGISVQDGSRVPLTNRRWSYVGQAVWLPDGSGLLMSASEQSGSPMQVWHIRLEDGAATQITHDLNNYREISLTRDASRLVAVQVQSLSGIWVAPRADAKGAQQMRSEVGSLGAVAWTRDGKVVYASSAGGSGPDIWMMNADGSNAKQVTIGARVGQGLAMTADGRHIIFSSGVNDRFHLWRVDSDGGNLRQLTDGHGEFYPQVTPDGRWVVYQSDLSIDPRLWKVPIEGGQSMQLATTRGAKPAVSPDSRLIAYSYLDVDLHPWRWGIGIISLEGGQRLKRFDFPPSVMHRYVRWSPDGQSIAFVNSPGGRSDIWLQPFDGGPPRQLTDFNAEQILAFDWSPDGRSLAFVRHVETSDAVLIQSNVKSPSSTVIKNVSR